MFQLLNERVQQQLHPSLRFIWRDLMNEEGRRYAIYTVLVVLAGSATAIIAPYGLGLIIDGVSQSDWNIFLFGLGFFVGIRWLDDRLHKKRLELRENVFQQNYWHIPQYLSWLFMRQPLGAYINTDDALDGGGVESVRDKVWNVVNTTLLSIVPNYGFVIFGLLACFYVNWQLGLIAVAYIAIEGWWGHCDSRYFSKEMQPIGEELRRYEKRVRAWWDAIALIKSNGVERRTIQAIHDTVQPTLKRDATMCQDWYPKALLRRRHFDLIVSTGLYGSAGYLVFEGELAVSSFVLLFFSFMRIVESLQLIADVQREVIRELSKIEPYRAKLVRPTLIPYDVGNEFVGSEVGIEFCNVSLSLGTNGAKRQVLRDVSFAIKPGERVGIVGPSGAGKTQLINLIQRVYNPDTGSIWVGTTYLKLAAPESWLTHVGYVPQDATVFDTSVRENVRFGVQTLPPAGSDDNLVFEALRRAGLNLSGRLTEGLDTLVGSKGLRLSGGQRQRLMIAQAIYKVLCCQAAGRPPLVIADEATSALDSISEAHVLDSLYAALPAGTTMLMIAHRLSSLYGCDKVLMVRPLERCAPNVPQVTIHSSLRELYTSEPLFREMADSQGFVPH